MPVDAKIQQLLEQIHAPGVPAFFEMTVPEAREAVYQTRGFNGPPPDLHAVEELQIATPGGPLDARLYRPTDTDELRPLLVFFFGGGWIMGAPDLIDTPVRELAYDSGLLVLSVGYRLAPEHPYPAALDDAFAAVQWASENAVRLGADPARILVGGESSGGNLAAAVALRARADGGPALAGQLLIYPVLDRDFDTDSYRQFGDGHLLTASDVKAFWQHYLGDAEPDTYAAPANAPDLAALPPTTVLLAECDPLRSEGQAYAKRLEAAGVPVEVHVGAGLTHGAWYMSGVTDAARTWARNGVQGFARQVDARAPAPSGEASREG